MAEIEILPHAVDHIQQPVQLLDYFTEGSRLTDKIDDIAQNIEQAQRTALDSMIEDGSEESSEPNLIELTAGTRALLGAQFDHSGLQGVQKEFLARRLHFLQVTVAALFV